MSDTGPQTSASREAQEAGLAAAGSPLERGFLRETADGTTVFFPWGLTHRGYVLPDEAARRRVLRVVQLLVVGILVIAAWLAEVLRPLVEPGASPADDLARAVAGPLAALAAVVGVYALWASRLAERLPESDLQVPRDERLREAASFVQPWKVALSGLGIVAMSVLLVCLDPRAAWLALAGALAGASLVLWAWVLQRAAAPRPGADAARSRSDDPRPL